MAFILILSGLIFGLGSMRGWDANSGYTHNTSETSRERFLPEPFIPEPGVKGRYGPEATARWYYWKLPPNEVTVYTRLFVWICYVLHQVLIWIITFLAQYRQVLHGSNDKYTTTIDKFNYIALALNVGFHLLHLLQTQITYDGTAQDTSIATSQASVIMLVIFILLMELKERGILFGWPVVYNTDACSRKLKPDYGPTNLIRRYHGYAFSWAAIYTFWYHPMENTWGHVMGFALTWMIMLQGSLMYTVFHQNKYWRLFVEAFVVIHGTVVAVQTGGPAMLGTSIWPMFTFGFSMVLVLTQIFLLSFWRRIHFVFRFLPFFIYIGVVVYMYSWIPDKNGQTWVRMQEIIRIPLVYYLFLFYVWFLLFVFLKIESKMSNDEVGNNEDGVIKKCAYVTLSVLIYAFFVLISALTQYYDIQLGLIVLMIIFVGIFKTGVCISMMLLKQVFPRYRPDLKISGERFNVSSSQSANDHDSRDSYKTFDEKL
ncbi:uncharacterized protein LOC126807635 [Patella vulgata]|uniref:uncharacterized protein LOC126807635 n=1 Tax=Patella vulgata TaxID=6465 RepID=UPI0021805196|nr:uncharacterized protein LOC126807635 [Patella vulgata]